MWNRCQKTLINFLWLAACILILSVSMVQARPAGRLVLRVLDADSRESTPVRVRITHMGRPIKQSPAAAVSLSYGLWDHADGFSFQPDSSFYIAGTCSLTLAPGNYTIHLSKGIEYVDQTHNLTIRKGQTLQKTFSMHRWIQMAARQWYSADGHIHLRRSPRENQPLLDWIKAEDVHVGVFLKMGDFWETYYPQYAFGEKGVYRQGDYLLCAGQEDPRTPELGHALGYGATASVRYRENYYYYDNVFDEIHRRGGLTGYAHQAESFHGYRGLTLDGLRGKVDMLELLQYCVSAEPLHTEHYYRMLNLGIPLTATAGSDFPWCGHDHDHGPPEHSARIGNARFYTYVSKPFSYQAWLESLAAGHTFVTSGPMLQFTVNGQLPGSHVKLNSGDSLTIRAEAFGNGTQYPLERLEVVVNGRVTAQADLAAKGQSGEQMTLSVALTDVRQGQWIAARCYAKDSRAAHTTPVYVHVGGGGFHDPATVKASLQTCEDYLRELETELGADRDKPEFRAWYYKKGLKTRIDAVNQVIAELKKQLIPTEQH